MGEAGGDKQSAMYVARSITVKACVHYADIIFSIKGQSSIINYAGIIFSIIGSGNEKDPYTVAMV